MMIQIHNAKGLPVAVVDDFYSEEELSLIWKELDFIVKPKNLLSPEENGTARDLNGVALKNFNGIGLDDIFPNRVVSDILSINRKLFDKSFTAKLAKINPFFRFIDLSNQDSSKVCVYRDGEGYKPHDDQSVITTVSMLCKEPKPFTGGELIVEDINIEYKNNRLVIFPGILIHEVITVNIPDNLLKNARFTLLQFLGLNIMESNDNG